ncbi:hypothetical protein B0H13DRAFT_1886496 [Mycena leptocephala]|nr:hypothetical protein B0H13DRAFT_1886496 [Mycena leptocephala]
MPLLVLKYFYRLRHSEKTNTRTGQICTDHPYSGLLSYVWRESRFANFQHSRCHAHTAPPRRTTGCRLETQWVKDEEDIMISAKKDARGKNDPNPYPNSGGSTGDKDDGKDKHAHACRRGAAPELPASSHENTILPQTLHIPGVHPALPPRFARHIVDTQMDPKAAGVPDACSRHLRDEEPVKVKMEHEVLG